MPPASSGRYQSRLFNFVHQQSRRWGEGLGRTFRHLQVAATLSLEALMYPFFQLIQKAVESSGKQLDGRQEQSKPQLEAHYTDSQPETPPVADTPILQVLQVVEHLQLENKGTKRRGERGQGEDSSVPRFPLLSKLSVDTGTRGHEEFCSPASTPPLSHSPTLSHIQGIASQLSNRQLVLVTHENEILDLLTPKQQQILEERIITEIANYWRRWRLIEAKKETNILSEINYLIHKLSSSKNDKIPALLPSGVKEDNIEYPYLLNPERSLKLLDATVAKLESNALMPISRASSELLQVIQTQLHIFVYGQEQLPVRRQTTVAADDLQNQTPKIQALIWAALNFFFGERKDKKLESNTSQSQASAALPMTPGMKPPRLKFSQRFYPQNLPPSSQIPNSYLTDPWLSEDDLFGEIPAASQPVNNQLIGISPNNNAVVLPSQKAHYHLKKLIYRFKAIALPQRKSKASKKLAQYKKSVLEFTAAHKTSAKVASTTQTASATFELVKDSAPTTQVEAKPDWIEIKAKLIGYEKHPLELILEWLDRAMLWIEKLFINIFYFLQGFFRIKN
ncbi:hypothetical protein ACF3DV_21030 [Chlorogloeopsis fritschii PCC 9212]|uniref:Uncharacterized protein n=1 Tax=Chlorogloeopsis fritschii PCC 6912 TaxID=211165 RepID=A0A3S0XRS5_CHLFR|nr:hypothetical protein [Chlorogloeopsis fritschii]RUR75531.1 hypothetical protein PCC6912_47620 [Chlorogloeopsis fritschii PCC 6912]